MFEKIPEPWLEPPTDDRKTVYVCSCCGENILEGDDYFDFSYFGKGLGIVCTTCVADCKCYDAERCY